MKILLLGKDGQVGWELQRSLAPLGEVIAMGRQEANLEDLDSLRASIRRHRPDIIVNAAAHTAVDKAESEPEKAHRINAEAMGVMAEEASQLNAWLVHYSTDYVFDGEETAPYSEDDQTNPLSVYGRTKLEGEQLIRKRHARHLIFRTSWVYAARGGNFAKTMLRLAKERDELKVIADQHGAPTSAEFIADVTALVLYRIRQEAGVALAGTYHLVASGETTWHGYAQYVLELAEAKGDILKTSPANVQPIPTEAYPLPAARPKNSRLNTCKLANTFNLHIPDWRYHVQRLMDELVMQGAI
ncbi:MAG: dTDP-4-dehydrorhamnose reductase [Nitrosomonadales bacterium]|nr:MAG: dTDP-4-dehydrorhamnose reductase [Nitrosomonadales bacterium]